MKQQTGTAMGTAVKPPIRLSIGGETRVYANDKEGKRQAIVDGLQAIDVLRVGDAEYLPNDAALQWVAAVLYPAGIETEAAYHLVQDVTEKACAHMGFGTEETLAPPVVPFAARGGYRKRYPPVDAEAVLAELARAGISGLEPRWQIACLTVWSRASVGVYGRAWTQLTAGQQSVVQGQVDALAEGAGWEREKGSYVKPLPVDGDGARQRLAHHLRQENGRPVLVSSVITQAQMGAYGQSFGNRDLSPELAQVVGESLRAQGYSETAVAGQYPPQPLTWDDAGVARMRVGLAEMTPVMTVKGAGLLLRDVLELAQEVTGVAGIGEWQAEQLIEEGEVSQTLRALGYQARLAWCKPLRPVPGEASQGTNGATGEAEWVILKEVRVRHDPQRQVSLATGLGVYAPALTIDEVNNTLVYLQMVGVKQSVKANWAALAGGGKVHWFGNKRIQLEGMKRHVKLQATLPCGWVDHILIHKQASLQEMNPERPFYLLDDGGYGDGRQDVGGAHIPPLFYAMLNKALALPLLPEWAEYLWSNGRARNLITLLDDGEGQGYAAWQVMPAGEAWQEIVQAGLAGGEIGF